MRTDFNKLLVERERAGSRMKYRDTRHNKNLNQDADRLQVGGREGMRRRHKLAGDYKSFNENLNPLRGWLRSQLGKKWDKSYSELRKTFDARGVINDHILQHLFDYVQIHTKLVDGEVLVLDGYNGSKSYVPLKEASSYSAEYYVCPKDGTLKALNRKSRRTEQRERQAEQQKELDKVFRIIDDKHHLHLEEDGNWYLYEVAKLPQVVKEYVRPYTPKDHLFVTSKRWHAKQVTKTWDELNEAERRTHGVLRITSGQVVDARTGKPTYREDPQRGYQSTRRHGVYSYGQPTPGRDSYYVTKQQAPHKVLKAEGLDGTARFKAKAMSHREAAKYR